MTMKDFIRDELNYYIENEKNYIQNEIIVCGFERGLFRDLTMLENLTEEKKEKIIDKVVDDEQLTQAIHETIHYYLYQR